MPGAKLLTLAGAVGLGVAAIVGGTVFTAASGMLGAIPVVAVSTALCAVGGLAIAPPDSGPFRLISGAIGGVVGGVVGSVVAFGLPPALASDSGNTIGTFAGVLTGAVTGMVGTMATMSALD